MPIELSKTITLLLLLLGSVALVTGCAGHTRELKATAANDFNCSTDRIVLKKGGKNGREATGCGQTASYRFAHGAWVREDEGGGTSGSGANGKKTRR